MARFVGRLRKLGIGKEATAGTAVAPTFWVPLYDGNFQDKAEYKDNEGGYGNIAAISDTRISKEWSDGDYSGKIQLTSVGLELTALHGASPTSAQRTITGVYDHTYDMVLDSNDHKTLTVAVAEPNYSGRYAGIGIDSWSLDTELGDFIRRTVSLMGGASASSSETAAYVDEQEFLTEHMSVRIAAEGANDATIDAATAIKLTGFKLEVKKNAELQYEYGSRKPTGTSARTIEITGEIEAYYDDRAWYTLANNNTAQTMRITIKNPDVIIGTSGSHNPELRFTLARVKFQLPERASDNNELTKQTIPFKASLSLANGKILTTRLTNDYAGTNY